MYVSRPTDEPDEEPEGQPDAEFAKEDAWRLDQFIRLGFADADASELALLHVDLAEARTLIGLGCPHQLARRILLPI